ncbi:MAG: hypothetical protein IPJ32_19860 [Sphingobacteriaceae bacterium]|nr:hypothetical protein [Sphingobacteriaceae bacterium]
MTNLIKYLKRSPSVVVIIVLIISCIWVDGNISKWNKKSVIDWDVTYYYCYLPATFIKKDLSLKFVDGKNELRALNHQYLPYKITKRKLCY